MSTKQLKRKLEISSRVHTTQTKKKNYFNFYQNA